METQRVIEGETVDDVECEMRDIRAGEDRSLTADLKERVALVEDQWRQALGKGMEECQARLKRYLVESDGWDEGLDE